MTTDPTDPRRRTLRRRDVHTASSKSRFDTEEDSADMNWRAQYTVCF